MKKAIARIIDKISMRIRKNNLPISYEDDMTRIERWAFDVLTEE